MKIFLFSKENHNLMFSQRKMNENINDTIENKIEHLINLLPTSNTIQDLYHQETQSILDEIESERKQFEIKKKQFDEERQKMYDAEMNLNNKRIQLEQGPSVASDWREFFKEEKQFQRSYHRQRRLNEQKFIEESEQLERNMSARNSDKLKAAQDMYCEKELIRQQMREHLMKALELQLRQTKWEKSYTNRCTHLKTSHLLEVEKFEKTCRLVFQPCLETIDLTINHQHQQQQHQDVMNDDTDQDDELEV